MKAAARKLPQIEYDLIVLIGILLAFSAWVLSLPCFPTTDGPVHMYYADILCALLDGRPSAYVHYFHIRHLLPPYALYYYALALLSRFVPMFLADKLIICGYFVLFSFGFRYFAQAVGPSGKLTSLLSTLLLLNWPLGMGFLSFCLSLSLSLWAAGLWLRLMGKHSFSQRIAFVLLSAVVMLAHPVPLLLLLLVTGLFLAVRFLHAARQAGRPVWPHHGRADLFTLGAATLNILYVRHFATAHPFDQDMVLTKRQYLFDVLNRFTLYGREHSLAFFLGRRTDLLVYRGGLLLILVVPLFLAFLQFTRNRRLGVWTQGDTLLFLGLTAVFVLPFVPTKLNDCFYFADRLLICTWLLFLLAASAWSPRLHLRGGGLPQAFTAVHPGHRTILAICCLFVVVVDGTLIYSSNRLLRPAANAVAAVGRPVGSAQGEIGFLMEDGRAVHDAPETLAWNPYYWALVHMFRENGDIMGNAPWMDESIIPVAPSAPLPEVSILTLRQPVPALLQRDLLQSPTDLRRTLAVSSFYVVNHAGRPTVQDEPLLHQARNLSPPWTCLSEDWYRVCRSATSEALAGGSLPTGATTQVARSIPPAAMPSLPKAEKRYGAAIRLPAGAKPQMHDPEQTLNAHRLHKVVNKRPQP